jgi:signal transduction histidine kinase
MVAGLYERWAERSRGVWASRRGSDVLLAVVLAAVQVAGTFGAARHQTDRRALDALAVTLLATSALSLVARRRHAVAVLGVAFVATFAYELLDYPGGPIWFALIVAFFTVQTTGHRLLGFVAIAVGYASAWWVPLILGRPLPSARTAVAFAAWMLVLVAVAEVVRVRRAYLGEVRRRAEEAEHARVEEARRRQGEERLRIARDLHDVLAHNISLMHVQASTALHLLDDQPQHARPALTAIKQASGEALAELRSALDSLRQAGDAPARAPVPDLSRLSDLAAQAAAAGLEVETVVDGRARPLPATVELAAFRICQEAVTNVIRHAGPATARVRLVYGDRELVVEIDDDGRGAASNGGAGGGNGLPGMRERTAALGGSLEAGSRPGGGFRISARLPLEPVR